MREILYSGASATLRETLSVRMMKGRFNFSIQPLSNCCVQLEFLPIHAVRVSTKVYFDWWKSWQQEKNLMMDSFRLRKHIIMIVISHKLSWAWLLK